MQGKLSTYSKGIIGFNLLALLFLSFYLWKGWGYRVFPSMNLVFFQELIISFLTLPFYAIWMNQLNKTKIDSHKFKRGFAIFLLLLLVTLYGSGMHNSANQIRTIIDEPIVFFYDEILSHHIFFTALFGIGLTIAFMQFNSPHNAPVSQLEKRIIIASGIFQGLIIGIGAMEAHFGTWALVLSGVFFGILLGKVRKTTIRQYPLSWYYLLHFGTTVSFLILFLVINKSFDHPTVFGLDDFKHRHEIGITDSH